VATRDCWSPAQYERFRNERSQPFFDLLALVRPEPGMRVADLGCGTGELTRVLHERLGAVETVGLDSSAAMLARAEAAPGLRFEQGDAAEFGGPARFDLVFSNAMLQWLGDHETRIARFLEALPAGGQLAIQMPANHDHPSHAVAEEVAAEEPFRTAMGGFIRRSPVRPPEWYAALLHRLGVSEQHVRLQVYGHVLGSREDVVEWVKGTVLTAYEARLRADLYPAFVERYRERLLPRLDEGRPYFYPFKRLLLWARR
jgi:trans-aconitate 2-methyltransferase